MLAAPETRRGFISAENASPFSRRGFHSPPLLRLNLSDQAGFSRRGELLDWSSTAAGDRRIAFMPDVPAIPICTCASFVLLVQIGIVVPLVTRDAAAIPRSHFSKSSR